MGGAILGGCGLSFIGFGARPSGAGWGVMISEGSKYFSTQPWLSFFSRPGNIAHGPRLNLIGDGLRDALDPRLRGNL